MTRLDNTATDDAAPPVDEAAASESARSSAALRVGRGVTHTDPRKEPDLPKIETPDEAKKLPPGSNFMGPDGQKHVVPYKANSPQELELVPDGADFVGPDGQVRAKPKYEDINFTSQTLYNMAVNDKEREKALERSYPGKVKKIAGTENFYVDDDGTMRRPKGFMSSPGAGIAGQIAPVAASIGGEILGGIGGSMVAPGPGTFGGAVAGGAAGGAAGQAFNDGILQLAGVYDRTGREEAAELGMAGAAGGVGTGVGRVLGRTVATPGAMASKGPKMAADFLGADAEGLKTAIGLREQGVDLVPPSIWAKESPHLQNIVEVLDPAFRTQKPLQQAATAHYEQSSKKILEDLGVKVEGSIVDPETAVPTQKAGRSLLLKSLENSFEADLKLHNALQASKASAQAVLPGQVAEKTSVEHAAVEARNAAQKIIDAGYKDIETDATAAMAKADAGHNSGDLWWNVGEKLKNLRQGLMSRANKMYGEADLAAGEHLPDVSRVTEAAEQFLTQLPEEFQREYPSIVGKIKGMGENPPTFGQLRNLRSDLRYNVDWSTLSSDVKNGSFKFFASRVDEALNNVNAVPELKEAARLLDIADGFYKENMPIFNSQNVKAVMKGLESGEAADPKALFKVMMRSGQSDLNKRIMDMVGPNLASGVRAADVQTMLDASKSWIPGQVDGQAFAKEVMSRYRDGMLHSIHGEEAGNKLFQQAQNIMALEGKIDIPVRPGDKALDVIERARLAGEAAEAAAKQDPLAALDKEMKRITQEHSREMVKANRDRKQDPLSFLYNPTVGASSAVDRILGSEDLILAAGAKFGEQSPEFNMLRQIYAQRVLQRSLRPGTELEKIAPEVQNLMFPGVTLDQMKVLAREMDALMGAKGMSAGAGKSIMATEAVEHPWSRIGGSATKYIPFKNMLGVDAFGRYALGKFFAWVTRMSSNLTLLRFVEKGLKGDAAAQARSRQMMQRMIQTGGATGAGIGESQFQAPNQ